MTLVAEGRVDPLAIVSHRLPLEDAPKGYELFDQRQASKVLLRP
jgi:threonine dehydrogenase-like Zn-dependent dehydrogenase